MSKEKQFEKFESKTNSLLWEKIRNYYQNNPNNDGVVIISSDLVDCIEHYMDIQEKRIYELEQSLKEFKKSVSNTLKLFYTSLDLQRDRISYLEDKIIAKKECVQEEIMPFPEAVKEFHAFVKDLFMPEKTQKKAKPSEKTKAKCECEKKSCKKGGK